MSTVQLAPSFSAAEAVDFAGKFYGMQTTARPLPSERDQNFHLQSADGREYVLKIAGAAEQRSVLELQNGAIRHLVSKASDRFKLSLFTTQRGEEIAMVTGANGQRHFVRLLSYLPGAPLAKVKPHSPPLLRSLGAYLGELDRALADFSHPAAERELQWDLKHARRVIRQHQDKISDPRRRNIVERILAHFAIETAPRLPTLRTSVIHNDANDYNVIVRNNGRGESTIIAGVIDFGDMVQTYTVCEVAIAAAYVMLDKPDPIAAATHLVAGYHAVYPLTEDEIAVLYSLVLLRLCLSVCLSAHQQQVQPANPYLSISEEPAWALLEQLQSVSASWVEACFRYACALPPTSFPQPRQNQAELLVARRSILGRNLSLSYQKPLKIVRGWRQYLYDEEGRAYLDVVNNVCHVGHCHPRVVGAGTAQMAMLNTNTRYLHDNLVEYARRLTATLPEPLRVCFFVNSGSEANDLALRLARAYTGQIDTIVVDVAYHGNLTSLIEISPYKHNGPGGKGAPPHVHTVVMPDPYRGPYKGMGVETGVRYAEHVRQAVRGVQAQGRNVAAFIAESLLGCGGQIVLPDGYLAEAYRLVRAAGGLCIADEVQVGFGRVGTHFWGFQAQGVIPDIVTMGKPIGNGHPLGAVVTTPEIAAAFANGMEYFNTFGGNPVSCAVGLAVLDVIEEEGLQAHALRVGNQLMAGLRGLMDKHPRIGDVRGLGLFVGVELVLDRATLEPASELASTIAERMRDHGILISTDGPFHNVLKLKPPLLFDEANADRLVATLDQVCCL